MSRVGGSRTPCGATALALFVSLWVMVGQANAQTPNTSLEPLLRVSDLSDMGLRNVVLAPPDAYDRTEELGFVTESDEYPVLNFSRYDVSGPGGGTLHEVLSLFATDLAVIEGVGDEAYSYLGGTFVAFRKGAAAFQLSSGLNVVAGLQPFLTTAQLAEVAKVICGRL